MVAKDIVLLVVGVLMWSSLGERKYVTYWVLSCGVACRIMIAKISGTGIVLSWSSTDHSLALRVINVIVDMAFTVVVLDVCMHLWRERFRRRYAECNANRALRVTRKLPA